jgi:hypothetical protein
MSISAQLLALPVLPVLPVLPPAPVLAAGLAEGWVTGMVSESETSAMLIFGGLGWECGLGWE